MAQSRGLGGVVGGVVGGLRNTVDGTVSSVGNTVDGAGGALLGGSGAGGGLLGSGAAGGGLPGTGGNGGGITGALATPGAFGSATRIHTGRGAIKSVVRQVTRQDVLRVLVSRLQKPMIEDWIVSAPPPTLAELRALRLQQLVVDNRPALEMGPHGSPIVRGRLIALDPTPAALKAAKRLRFTVLSDYRDATLGIRSVTLGVPRNLTTPKAAAALRTAAATMTFDFDHIYEPAGGTLAASSVALAAGTAATAASGPVIGMIDGGVGESPALETASIEQRGFAGAAQATGHGTAVASLIVGNQGKFRGAAPGATLLVGDVYGGNPAAGSASSIIKAMSWMVAHRPSVINVSLVGPRNKLVERAVAVALARGIKVVAAVGNDGPAAPALYPASQPGVIAVTGVCKENRALPEASKALHLDYAAPGADMAAALPGGGYSEVRGTSFAAPYVSARLALVGSTAQLDARAHKGHGRIGRGIVCYSCRIAPKAVGVK